MANHRLRDAVTKLGITPHELAAKLDVDPKTVERWISTGRTPYRRHRHQVAVLVRESEGYLWPEAVGESERTGAATSEFVHVYPHRASVPPALWSNLFGSATRAVDILIYSGMFLADQNPRLGDLLAERAEVGARVRIVIGDPDSPQVAERGAEEGIGDALASKIRNVLIHYQHADVPGVDIRLHATTLYNSIYRFDDELLVNSHVYGFPAAHAPVLHVRKLSTGIVFDTYMESFKKVWESAVPAWPDRAAP